MAGNRLFRLKYRLTFNFLLMLIPVLILGYITQMITNLAFEEQAITSTSNTMEQTAKNVEGAVQSVYELYKQVITDEEISAYLQEPYKSLNDYERYSKDKKIQEIIIGYTHSAINVSGIAFITSDGRFISNMSDITNIKGRETSMIMGSHWSKVAKDSRGKFVLLGKHEELDDIRFIYKQDSKFDNYAMATVGYINNFYTGVEGLIVFDISRDAVRGILKGLDLGEGSQVHLVSRDGRDIALNRDSNYVNAALENKFEDTQLLEDIFSSDTDQASNYITYEGQEYLMVSHKVYKESYVLIGLIPKNQLLQTSRTIEIITMLLLIASGIVIIILGAFVFPNNIYRRVNSILRKMQKVKNGNMDIEEQLDGNDEFAIIDTYFNSMVTQLKDTIQDNYVKQLEKQEAELNALQFQINPHFLYNTLASINSMATVNGNDDIAEMTEKLGDMFRYSINSSSSEYVSLGAELEHIQNYINIENVRFSHKIHMFIDSEPIYYQARVLKFILQPVVENAVKHGFKRQSMDGFIDIHVDVEDQELVITISDDGKGMSQEVVKNYNDYFRRQLDQKMNYRSHIGLKNVNARLQLAFGNQYGLTIHSQRGTEVTIRLPFMNEQVD